MLKKIFICFAWMLLIGGQVSLCAGAVRCSKEGVVETLAVMDVGSTGTRYVVVYIYPNNEYCITEEGKIKDRDVWITKDNLVEKYRRFIDLEQKFRSSESYGPDTKVIAYATEGFRLNKGVGEALAQLLRELANIDFQIISQQEEARLVCLSARSKSQDAGTVILDVGGGSMQAIMSGCDESLVFLGNESGNMRIQKAIQALPQFAGRRHFYGLSPKEFSQIKKIVRDALQFGLKREEGASGAGFFTDPDKGREFARAIQASNGHVIGVGLFHFNAIHSTLCPAKNCKFYTHKQINEKLAALAKLPGNEKGLARAKELLNGDEFYTMGILDFIVADAIMDVLGIKQVNLSEASNLEGIIIDYLQTIEPSL